MVPLLPADAAGHEGHGVLAGAPPPHPRGQEERPPGHLRHPAVGPPTPAAPHPPCGRPLLQPGELPLVHAPPADLLPQPAQLGAGHLLGRHAGKGLGEQGAAQEPPAEVRVLGVPQVCHLAPHTGLVPELVGFVELVDVLLDGSRQLCCLLWVRGVRGVREEGGEEELDTFGSGRF